MQPTELAAQPAHHSAAADPTLPAPQLPLDFGNLGNIGFGSPGLDQLMRPGALSANPFAFPLVSTLLQDVAIWQKRAHTHTHTACKCF